jgi:hypothetical protein
VVLRDTPGVRAAPMVAQYFERRLSRGVESINRLDSGSGQLIMLGTTWRYIVPPWLTELSVAVPRQSTPQWYPVPVHAGLTAPLPWWWFSTGCQSYVVIRTTSRPATGAAPMPVTMFGGNNPQASAPRVWFRDPDPRRPDTGYEGDDLQWAALRAIACGSMTGLSDSGDLRIGRVWTGSLPGLDRAALITVDASAPPGRAGRAALIDEDGHNLTEQGATNSDFSSGSETLAGAVWWHSPRGDNAWRLVAAAGRGIARLKAVGEFGTYETRRRSDGTLLLAPPPDADGLARRDTRLPVVQIIAYEDDGDRTVISPS